MPLGRRRHDPRRPGRHVLVIGSEVYSRILNFADRGTCVLFGDGAGAVLLQARDVAQATGRAFSPPICIPTARWPICSMSMARSASPTNPAIW